MQRRHALKAALLGGLAASAPALANTKKPITWKMVTSWPKNAPGVGTSAARLAKIIETLSNGRLRVKLYAAGEIVPPFGVLSAVQKGTADIGHTALYYAAGQSQAFHFFTTIPFGLSAGELAAWYDHGEGQALKDELMASFNVRAFYVGSSGPQAMGWFNKEINSVDDLKGLKMRIAGLGGMAMQKLGVTPVMMPPGDILPAMQMGTVDAAEWVGPWNDIGFGLYKVAKYYYLPAFHEPGPGLDAIVNQESLSSLPEDLQAIVIAACRLTAAESTTEFLYNNIQSYPALKDHGVEIRQLPASVSKALGKASLEVINELIEKGDDNTQKIGKAYLAFVKKSSGYAAKMEKIMLEQRDDVWR